MAKATKILEIKGKSWMAGYSLQQFEPIGGLFEETSNFDPFEKKGLWVSSVGDTEQGSATTVIAGLYPVGVGIGSGSNSRDMFVFGRETLASMSSTTKVYQLRPSDGFVTDRSSKITALTTSRGATFHKGRILYAGNTQINSTTPDLSATPTQTTVLAGLTSAEHQMVEGPDRNLYATNSKSVAKIINVGDTTGNTTAEFTFLDDTYVSSLENDGEYLVIAGYTYNNKESIGIAPHGNPATIADTTAFTRTPSNHAFVAFWDTKRIDLTRVWKVRDERIYAIKRLESNDIIVFGERNIYMCSVSSPLKVLMSLENNSTIPHTSVTAVPFSTGAVDLVKEGVVHWVDRSNLVWGYGRPHPSLDRVFFQPYRTTPAASDMVSVFHSEEGVWVTTSDANLYEFFSGSRGDSLIRVSNINFSQPYEFAFAKVFLEDNLSATGDKIELSINTAGGKVIFQGSSFNFTDHGAKNSFIFKPNAGTSIIFENIIDLLLTNTKQSVRRFEIWAYPVSPDQDLM
jgi:hypothetical protein